MRTKSNMCTRLYPGPEETFFPLALKDITEMMVKCVYLGIE